MFGSAAKRLALLAIIGAGVALVACGLSRWRSEAAAHTVAEEFLSALIDGDADALKATLTPALAARLRTADPTLQATLSVPTRGATARVQRIRLKGHTAKVRAVVQIGRQQVAFDLALVHSDEHGWKVAGVTYQKPRKTRNTRKAVGSRRAVIDQ